MCDTQSIHVHDSNYRKLNHYTKRMGTVASGRGDNKGRWVTTDGANCGHAWLIEHENTVNRPQTKYDCNELFTRKRELFYFFLIIIQFSRRIAVLLTLKILVDTSQLRHSFKEKQSVIQEFIVTTFRKL